MRVLMTLHHEFERNRGASGVSLRIVDGLRDRGCVVDTFGFGEAFRAPVRSVVGAAKFPLALAVHLRKHARDYDVIDASSGDAWLWAKLGRPGAKAQHALITRSHGLEMAADVRLREQVRQGQSKMSLMYPFYHGGFRLWEVGESMRLADRCIVLNEDDRALATERCHLRPDHVAVIPHGIDAAASTIATTVAEDIDELKIAFIGTWIERKGITTIASSFQDFIRSGRRGHLLLLGTIVDEATVLESFEEQFRDRVTVVPSFENSDLSQLLAHSSVLLMLSRSEGFGLALLEGMMCGLVPIATAVGVAPRAINDGRNGFIVPVGDAEATVHRMNLLHDERSRCDEMAAAARWTAGTYAWESIISQTIDLYMSAMRHSRAQISA